jgi:flagellar basal-body rod modification protein FlgD
MSSSTISSGTLANINGTSSTGTSSSSSSTGGTSASDLQTEFMQLLVAQLKNQDPSAPTDSTQFVTQLAQISQLQAATTTNTEISSLGAAQSAATNASMASLVGKTVTARASTLTSDGVSAPALQLHLDGAASKVEVDILDSSGNKVKTLQVGPMSAGDNAINWATAGGGNLPAGSYTVQVKATSGANSINATPEIKGVISSLTFNAGNASFNVGGSSVSPSDILSIGN